MRTPVSVGVVGLGRRGLELAAGFDDLPQAKLRWLCEERREPRLRVGRRFPEATVTATIDDLLADEAVDAIVIAAGHHDTLVRRALEADKHVFVDAPLTRDAAQAGALVRLAAARRRALVIGEPLVARPGVRKLKELVDTGRLGELYYLYANRQGLGRGWLEESALWDVGSADVSMLLYLLDDEPVEVTARGESYVRPGVPDVVFCYFRFATGIGAHLHLSWLDPLRLRRATAVGSKRMAVFDDLEHDRKLTIYQQTAARPHDGEPVDHPLGDAHSPRLDTTDPVRLECERLVAAVRGGSDPAAGRRAVSVVRVLEAVQDSLDRDEDIRPAVERTVAPLSEVVPLRPRRRRSKIGGRPPLDQSEAGALRRGP